MRRLRLVIAVIMLGLVAGPSRLAPDFGLVGGTVEITAVPVHLDPGNPGINRLGELQYLRGWRLTSTSPEFGGLSALRLWRGGWLAVQDTGALISFSPFTNQAKIAPVNPRCEPRRVRLGRDLEGLDTDGTRIWVSSEWHNTICRLDPTGTQSGVRPHAMRDWPRQSGPETLLRLRDGRFLVMPEDTTFPALLFPADPVTGARPRQLLYNPPEGYSPTDAAELPDGRIVILNRTLGLRGFAGKLVLFDGLPAHGTAQGRTIATLAAPLTHDNFEGIAAHREGGATTLTLISDDNYSRWEQTLLLQFRLED